MVVGNGGGGEAVTNVGDGELGAEATGPREVGAGGGRDRGGGEVTTGGIGGCGGASGLIAMAAGGGNATGMDGGGAAGVDIGAKGGVSKGGETIVGGDGGDTTGDGRGGFTTGSGCGGGVEVVEGKSSEDGDNEGANDIVES